MGRVEIRDDRGTLLKQVFIRSGVLVVAPLSPRWRSELMGLRVLDTEGRLLGVADGDRWLRALERNYDTPYFLARYQSE